MVQYKYANPDDYELCSIECPCCSRALLNEPTELYTENILLFNHITGSFDNKKCIMVTEMHSRDAT
jgi:hypothetical protein